MASDSIWLRISPVCDVYLPNAFQPDDDGRNDWFYPQTASCVRLVRVLRVYSRWGELVFERRDFDPNEETLGWDGRFRQQEMTPGVFTWYGEFELTNGQQLLLGGDVTVVR
jgi:gliding motility-associated-like protein